MSLKYDIVILSFISFSFGFLVCESTFDVVSSHCMQIYRQTKREEKFAARNYETSMGVTA